MADDKLKGIEVGQRLHAIYKADGEYYPATVVAVSPKKRTPIKVHFGGFGDECDAWVPISALKNKKLGLMGKEDAKAKPKAKAKAAAEEVKYDYSGLTKGMKMSVKAEDDKYYAAEVVTVSKKKGKTPVKVHWVGYTDASDEWVGPDRIRSKELKKEKPAAKAKAEAKAKTKGPGPLRVGAKGLRRRSWSPEGLASTARPSRRSSRKTRPPRKARSGCSSRRRTATSWTGRPWRPFSRSTSRHT
jgi:hypothetical protein